LSIAGARKPSVDPSLMLARISFCDRFPRVMLSE